MNGILCLILINQLILRHWRGRDHLRSWSDTTRVVLEQLAARDYGLTGLRVGPLPQVFEQLIRTGRLQPARVLTLLTWIRRLDQAEDQRRRQGLGAMIRLGLGAGVGLCTSLWLDHSFFLNLAVNPPALLLIMGQGLIIFFWLQRLKPHPLTQSEHMQAAFTAAWLGQSQEGPWHANWMHLDEQSRLSGRDGSAGKEQWLEDWLLQGQREQEKRLIWAEELFGLVELAGSVYFLGTACALPLLRQWSP